MTVEWIRFWITAVLILSGLITLTVAVCGLFRFRFALNRIHAAAMSDTLALLLIVVGLIVARGAAPVSLKLMLAVGLQWCTSPISAHLLSRFEYLTDKHLHRYCQLPEDAPEQEDDHVS